MRKQRGFSLLELLIVVAIILIIAAIAIPNLLRSKMSANEASACSSMRTINTGEVAYATTYPNVGYSADLPSLGGPSTICDVAGSANSANACVIDDIVATAISAVAAKSGYFFTYTVTATAGGVNTSYSATGAPVNSGTTGQRFFYTDQTGVIRYGLTGAATANSSPIE
jgi:type IV pilus assembly protein PilA